MHHRLQEVRNILIDADVNLQIANSFIQKVKENAIGMKVAKGLSPGQHFMGLIANELISTMGGEQVPLAKRTDSKPTVIMLFGLQGAGKTTAAAKLANWMVKKQHSTKILLVAADIYRPAAIDQLQTLGKKLGIDVYSEPENQNPVKILQNGYQKAMLERYDAVIVDTAGRQVVDNKLMKELKEMKSTVFADDALLVVDAMTGQEAATLTARLHIF